MALRLFCNIKGKT